MTYYNVLGRNSVTNWQFPQAVPMTTLLLTRLHLDLLICYQFLFFKLNVENNF